ncbi:hypothetical protein F66182_15202 [Fusarium sp. NRRL 66182]|nr:hypothetical protein F66182_15202 [Fusarium sp. NRRL 66182]
MSAPPELISVATGLMIVTRSVGATVALAVNNVIFNNSMDKEVPSKVAAAVLPLGFSPTKLKDLIQALLSNNADLVAKVSGLTPEISFAAQGGLFDAYSISFRHVWTAATCFCAAGLLSSLFLRNSKSDFNAHIDAPIEVDREFEDATSSKSIEHAEHVEIGSVERAA